ncbi:lysophosphatidic acid receptor 4 [Hoplias malabaricus]|uniref:lysophosphatidic acid receptor 4 n=1 Tax=Hoplias malabaricus TaxID=27720 RepID=UPI003463203B
MSNSTNSTDCHELEQIDIGFIVVYALVFVAGLTLNLMALIIFFCQTSSRSHTMVYMTNLAIADLLLVCTLPFKIYQHCGFELSKTVCEIFGVILLANMYGSIFLLTSICLDRCLAVCFPLSSRLREGRKMAPVVCVGIWVLTLGASLPNYLFGRKQLNNTRPCFRRLPLYAIQTYALTSSLIIGFGIPLVIMVLCSWGLVQAIKKSTAAQTDGLVNSSKIQKMISANLAIFIICFLPYHVMLCVIYTYGPNPDNPCSLISAYQYSLMVACLNTTLDPLAYYFTTETFRKKVEFGVVWRLWPLNSHSSDENNRSRVPLST